MGVHRLEVSTDKHCRKWRIRYYVKANGALRQRSCVFHGTRKEAQAEEERLKSSGAERRVEASGRLSDVSEEWVSGREARGSITDVTAFKHRAHVRRVVREIGDVDVSKVTSDVLQGMFSAMACSPEYAANIRASLHTMFRDLGFDPNPCDGLDMPKRRRSQKPIVSADGLRSASSVADGSSVCSFVVALLAQTGMRRGEACALSLDDLDFDGRVIHVRASIDRFGRRKEPKTEEGVRDLPMTDGAEATLRGAVEAFGAPNGVVFPSKSGGWMDPHAVTRWWDRNRSRLGFDGVTVHGLRHAYLSELARRGVPPKTLQAIAGHSKISTTMDIYAHANLDDKRAATALVDW